MAHGERAARWQQGKDYGKSRLHPGWEERGAYTKFLTHKKERRAEPSLCPDCQGTGRAPFGSGWEPGVGLSDNICITCRGDGVA